MKNKMKKLKYIIVNESGTSVYSCSEEAKNEFPKIDPLYISSIMIARIPLNPISEYVKVYNLHILLNRFHLKVLE